VATIEKRVSADNKTSYRVKIRMKGEKPVTATFDKLTDAKSWEKQTETEIKHGRYFQKAEGRKHTLSGLIERYLPTIQKKKDTDHAERHLKWWKERIGEKYIADVTPALISSIKDELAAGITTRGQRSQATVNRYLAALSPVLSMAAGEWQLIETNPLSKVKKFKESQGRVRFLSEQERDALLDACRKSKNTMLYPIVVLAISTGMRQGEILSLRWKDVDFVHSRILLDETKNGERRQVPLLGAAMDELRKLDHAVKSAKVRVLEDAGEKLVFASGAGGSLYAPVRLAWDKAVDQAKISNFRFHDLRHTAASHLAMNGATLTELSELLGHKTLAMVKRYSHLTSSHLHNVVKRMNTAFLSGQGKV